MGNTAKSAIETVRRIPFTLVMVALILAVGILTGSHLAEISDQLIRRLGFAPRDLGMMRYRRIFTSALVTGGGASFWIALAMVGLTVGAAERRRGTWQATVAFWGVHLVTIVLQSVLSAAMLHLQFTCVNLRFSNFQLTFPLSIVNS